MKAFITGGAGFIGSHIADKLVTGGHEVTVFDNLSSGRLAFIESHIKAHTIKFIEDDLLNLDILSKSLQGHDIVFHLAANPEARWGIERTRLDLEQETIATYNVLEAMRRCGARKIVLASSGTIYGETPFVPIKEDYGPALPISLYGAGKLAAEGLVGAFCGTFGLTGLIVRFANIVGPRSTHGVIYDFVNKLKRDPGKLEILGDGTQEKPYLHVTECIDGIFFLLEAASGSIQVYNLGCDTTTTVESIASEVIRAMKLTRVERIYTGGNRGWPGDVAQVRFDIGKIKELGWQARMVSDQAVARACEEIAGELMKDAP